ncbi:MAG: hypothetical protein H7X79_01645 [Sporomusaceae bacterium]|nr:hypothetical protein [Sporomusaceae bacterium]
MDHILLVPIILVGIHAYTFARWLSQEGNTRGAIGMYVLIAVSLALPVYRMLRAG